ncbi:MAG TPA: AlpA family phage regulatory protein [Blastocatellia bacterium]|nr:AlpA family phage regulatory protein [Blastocatellia bacterium]
MRQRTQNLLPPPPTGEHAGRRVSAPLPPSSAARSKAPCASETGCTRCDKSRLEWDDEKGRQVLLEANGHVHVCSTSELRIARDFMPNKILRKPSVLDRTGWSAPTLWRRVKDGSFPPPRKIGPRAVGWLESEVEAAIAAFPIVNQEKRPAS